MSEKDVLDALGRYRVLYSWYGKNYCNCSDCLKYRYLLFVDFLIPGEGKETLMFRYENLETVKQMNEAINDVVKRFNGVWQNGTRKVYAAEPIQAPYDTKGATGRFAPILNNGGTALTRALQSGRLIREGVKK